MTDFTGGTWRSLVDGSEVSAIPDSVVSREEDDGDGTTSNQLGLEVELKSDWPSIGAEISNLTSGATRAYLQDDSGSDIDSIDISDKSSGDSFTFDDVNLPSGERYRIVLDAEGSDYTRGFASDGDNYPYTTEDIDITGVVLDGDISTSDQARGVNHIGNVGFD